MASLGRHVMSSGLQTRFCQQPCPDAVWCAPPSTCNHTHFCADIPIAMVDANTTLLRLGQMSLSSSEHTVQPAPMHPCARTHLVFLSNSCRMHSVNRGNARGYGLTIASRYAAYTCQGRLFLPPWCASHAGLHNTNHRGLVVYRGVLQWPLKRAVTRL